MWAGFVFLITVRLSLGSYFTGDTLMNLHGYWILEARDWSASATVALLDRYRPVGALVYLPVYRAFGFDPVALNVSIALLQALNVILFFRLSLRWVGTATAFLAAGAFAFHGGMAELRYSGGTVYDTLTVLFVLAGATLFLRCADSGVGWVYWAAYAMVVWAGILSKEHFAAFPAILVAVMFFEGRQATGRMWAAIGLAAAAILLAAAYRYVHGDPLLKLSPYALRFDPELVRENLRAYWYWTRMGSTTIGVAMVALLCASAAWCVARGHAAMFLGCSIWVAASMLPLLVIPPRSGFVLYLAWIGASMALAMGLEWLRGRPAAAIVVALVLLWRWHAACVDREPIFSQSYQRDHRLNRNFAAALPSLPPHSADHPLLLVTDCWLADQWEPWFIARLALRTADFHMDRARRVDQSPRPRADYAAVLNFDGERVTRYFINDWNRTQPSVNLTLRLGMHATSAPGDAALRLTPLPFGPIM